METETKDKISAKLVLTVILTTLITLGIASGGYFAYTKFFATSDKEVSKPKTTETSPVNKAQTNQVPSNWQKVTVNGVDVYYPASWQKLTTQATKEELSGEMPWPTFEGESATSDKPRRSIEVMNEGSVAKETSDYVISTNNYLKKVYNEQKMLPEEFFATKTTLLPVVNAGTNPYNPRYIESSNGKWRGYWYMATQGQQINCNPNFIALLYNKDLGKIISIQDNIVTSASQAVDKGIWDLMNGNEVGKETQVNYNVDSYMKSAYFSDSAIKSEVDDDLKLVSYLN